MAKRHLKKGKRKILLFAIIVLVVLGLCYGGYRLLSKTPLATSTNKYVASNGEQISLIDKDLKEVTKVYRGTMLKAYNDYIKDEQNNNYIKVEYNDKKLYVNELNLVDDKEKVVTEDKLYVRTTATLYADIDQGAIANIAKKGEELAVLGFNNIDDKGIVDVYYVQMGEHKGYIYGKYLLLNKEEALKHYEPEKYYDVHNKRGNTYGGGYAGNLDFYPVDKPKFEDNIMPDQVYSLYLNTGVIKNVDAYIAYAKTTNINAFVVDIKDDDSIGYKSDVLAKYSPTNNARANNSFQTYKDAITKIKEAGFYVIGRITAFKDKNYCMDNPGDAILNTSTGEPYKHDNTYWPSPYQRSVWEYTVDLAKEAVTQMGFNEIQFDYVRFPDRTGTAEKSGVMNFRNEFNEEKAQAIQGFVRYATDELHKLKVYVSVDVFGESAYTYVTAYGQYWPAISNIVDVISGMPYPDHFNKYDFGFKEPVWTKPYDLLTVWSGKYVAVRQQEIPTPAVVRTWVQVSDVPSYKHAGGYAYGVEQIDAQIRALYDAGLTGGYMTWLSSSNLERYKKQKEVYDKEY